LQQKLQKIENPKNNISNSGITDASNLNDISGTFSQDMQRITYFKLQEKENADLKTKLSTIESQYKDAIEGYRNKLSKKNKKIKSLEKSLNDMRRSFKTLSDNMKEMNVRTSKLEEVCTSKNINQFQTRFYADKDLSSES
jgi:predicted RNase H-like nuclease (RuvC/YqgF family)